MPGPPPAPEASRRRRNHTPAARLLPAAGRPGPPPPWPLQAAGDPEAQLWAELWASPQAVAWADMGAGLARVVARYVRWTVAAEVGVPADVATSALAELRQLEDRLGLTPMALARLRWDIVADPTPPEPQTAESPPPASMPPAAPEPPPARPRVRAQDTG